MATSTTYLEVVGDDSAITDPRRAATLIGAGGALMLGGSIGAIVGALLTWGKDAGKYTSYVDSAGISQPGETFSGIDLAGGSWFGYLLIAVAVATTIVAVAHLAFPMRRRWPKLYRPGLALGLGIAALALPLAYLTSSPAPEAVNYQNGFGAVLAVIAGAVVAAGALTGVAGSRMIKIDDTVKSPWQGVVLVGIGVVVLVVAVVTSWIYDERRNPFDNPETAAQVEALQEEGTAEAAAQVAQLFGAGTRTAAQSLNAVEPDGPQFGYLLLFLGAAALIIAVVRAWLAESLSHRNTWLLDVVVIGLGIAVLGIATAWIITWMRFSVPLLVAGTGSAFAMAAGLLFMAAPAPYLKTLGVSAADH